MLKHEVMQSSVEGVYAEEERRTLALSYLIRNLFEAKSLDECLDVAIKGLSMLDFFQSQISLLEDGCIVVKRNHMNKKYQFLLEKIGRQKFLGLKIDTRTSFVSHLLDSKIVTTLDIKDTVKVKLEDIVTEFLPEEMGASKRLGIVARVVSIIPRKMDLLILPLNYRGRVIGAVGISGTSLGHEDFLFLRNLCELFAQAFEKVQTKSDLRKSEEKYRQLVENLGEGIWVIDKDAYTTFVNPRMAEMLGYTVNEMQGKHLFSFMDERGVEICKRNLERRQQGIKEQHDFEFLRKDGTKVYTRIETSPITDDDGNYIGALASVMDITERKKMEERVAYLASIVDNAKVAIATVDMKGVVTYCNKATEEMLGWTSEEVIGKLMAILCPNAGEQIETTVREGFCLDKELEYIKKDGSPLVCSTSTFLIKDKDGNPIGVGGIAIDVTKRKKAEEELVRLSSAVKMSIDGIVVGDLNAKIIDVNEAILKMYGSNDKGDLIGKKSFDLIAPEDREKAFAGLKETLEKGYTRGREYHIIIKDGSKILVEMNSAIMKNVDGKPIGFVSIIRDITERKKMEVALERQRDIAVTLSGAGDLSEALNRLFDNLLEIEEFDCVGVYLVDKDTGALDMIVHRGLPDRFVEKVSHIDVDSPYAKVVMEGKPIYQKTSDFPPAIREDLQSDGILAVAVIPIHYEGEVIGDLNMASHTYDEISASARHVLESVGAQVGEVIVRARMEEELRQYSENLEAMVEERTRKLKETQERLIKSERLAAVGELATMVGHDLRNPLQSIENAAYYLNNELSHHLIPQKAIEMLHIISDSVNYADRIIRDLQDFSATKKPIFKKTNINMIVKETLSQFEAPENVKLITELGHLPKIKADRDLIKRVFLNLAVNGIQAMKNGGTLKVSTKKAKGFVEVNFKDTGIGMSKENMKKIFTPFFTTKAKGMGMGLPICKRFVESHGGSIEAESEEGKESTFTVKLPIQQKNGGEKA